MTKAQATGLAVYHVVVKIDPHCAMPIAGRQLIHNALGVRGPVIAVRPDAKSPAATKQVEFVLASSQSVEQITAKGRIPTIAEEVTVEQLLAASANPQGVEDGSASLTRLAEESTPNLRLFPLSLLPRPARRLQASQRRRKICCAWMLDVSTTY